MKTCPECGIALKDEYQFCPEDGASLDLSSQAATPDVAGSAKAQAPPAVVLYCPACAAEYPLTFSECPVHHTTLTKHGMPPQVDNQPRSRRLHLVTPDEQPKVESTEATTRRSGIEAYEAALENLVEPSTSPSISPSTSPSISPSISDDAGVRGALSLDEDRQQEEAKKFHKVAMAVAIALALLALLGIYALISNASRKPAKPAKSSVAADNSAQPAITVPTPQAALDYQNQAHAAASTPTASEPAASTNNEAPTDARAKVRRGVDDVASPTMKVADRRSSDNHREQMAAPSPRPAPTVSAQPAMMRQPSATELVLPRGTFGQVAARLTGVRAARTLSGYRYELTFHLAEQAGQATQWERLAIVTRAASGATRQQQIPFYHRLGADGTMSFTVRVDMPGRAPTDWQGRIICTSIGSDSNGRVHRASFGASVSPD
ncbi:MAG: hypothetical protein ACJ74J_22615 [Blastocatellia bacterium]